MAKYKMLIEVQVWCHKVVEVEADTYKEAHKKAMEVYQSDDVFQIDKDYWFDDMDCSIEEYEDD